MSATDKIELFNSLFYVSLTIAVIGLVLSVFFFFFFNIRDVHVLMTGKAKRKTIERMEEQNSRTGHLRTWSDDIKNTSTARTNKVTVMAMEETTYLDTSNDTTLLQQPSMETTILDTKQMEEDVSNSTLSATTMLSSRSNIRFDVTEETLVIHTTEEI